MQFTVCFLYCLLRKAAIKKEVLLASYTLYHTSLCISMQLNINRLHKYCCPRGDYTSSRLLL